MFDINYIKENKEEYKQVCENKGIDLNIDYLLELHKKRKELIRQQQELRAQQNKLTKEDIEKGREIKEKLRPILKELGEVEKEYREFLQWTPNIYSEDTPVGLEGEGREVYKWGKVPDFDFTPRDHISLGEQLDILDLKKGVETSGFRGYYLKREGARLHWALLWYTLNKIIEKGFVPIVPPTIVRRFALTGSGDFPFNEDDIYQIANPERLEGEKTGESKYLVGTSEPSLLAYFSGETLKKQELPKKVCALTPCYRLEVGSYGKDLKGLYRIHEFMKVEQVVVTENDTNHSNKILEELKEISKEIIEELELPYRVIQIPTGDMGAGKYKMYDLETWMPSRNSYGETHSDSNLTDWQARRLGIKYVDENGEKKYAHTLNDTGLASPRILIAILENFQNKDGSVDIPRPLQKYVGFKKIKRK